MKKTIKHKKRNKYRKYKNNYIQILCLVILIVLILLIVKYCNKEDKLKPTGNVDIFELKCDRSECTKCESCSKGEIDESIDPVFNEEENKEEKIEGFNIFDNRIHWTTESELRIFENPAYEFRNILAPGSYNSYVYRVRNNNDFAINYITTVIEENINNINMKYRLKKNGIYIKGDKDNYVTYDKLNLENMYLEEREYDEYIMEWIWIESANDTEIGTKNNASYRLTIEITGIET